MIDDIDVMSDRRVDTEASYFHWLPGQWPETVTYGAFAYERQGPRFAPDGELLAMHYVTTTSIGARLLVVWND